MSIDRLLPTLLSGGIAVLRTDTLYGIVAQASNEKAVERIFRIKQRDRDKPLIVLIASASDAYDGASSIKKHTDGITPTTIIVPSPSAPKWLQHDDGTVAYRIPIVSELRSLIQKTGPLVAPSANPQGEPPARMAIAAQNYFGTLIDYYCDGGEVPADQAASIILRVHQDGSYSRLR